MNREFPILGLENFHSGEISSIRLLNHTLQGKNQITAHKHDFYLFFLIEHGSGTHNIDFIDYKVADRQLHILLPGQVHHWHLAEDTKGYQLMFDKKLFQTFINNLNFSPILNFRNPALSLSKPTFQLLYQEFQQLNQELKQEKPSRDIILLRSHLISRLISREIERAFESPNALPLSPILLKYTELIDKYYKQEKAVSFYAQQLNISPNYLNILCKRHVGLSAGNIIKNHILLETKRLLRISEMSIKEIAYYLGFNDLAYFSNFFKSHTGLSPSDFRA